MTLETLDETLDRVAAEITAVPPDATFVGRLRPRLDGSEHVGVKTVVAAACILALAFSGALVRRGGSQSRPVTAVARSTNDGIAALAKGAQAASARSDAVESPPGGAAAAIRLAAGASARRVIEHTAAATAIPALSEPGVLEVAHLQLDPLVVHPADVSSLEIVGLPVSEAVEIPKE